MQRLSVSEFAGKPGQRLDTTEYLLLKREFFRAVTDVGYTGNPFIHGYADKEIAVKSVSAISIICPAVSKSFFMFPLSISHPKISV